MESCAFTGGRFVATATGVEARYFVTDHLGSVRAVVNDEGEVLERNDYYPFGSRWDDGLLSDNRYRYNGKVYQVAEGGDMIPCTWPPDTPGMWQWEEVQA